MSTVAKGLHVVYRVDRYHLCSPLGPITEITEARTEPCFELDRYLRCPSRPAGAYLHVQEEGGFAVAVHEVVRIVRLDVPVHAIHHRARVLVPELLVGAVPSDRGLLCYLDLTALPRLTPP